MKHMTYRDAMDFLRIASNAYDASAFDEAYDILYNVAHFIAYEKDMPASHREEIITKVKRLTGRFQGCPDECYWEKASVLYDLLR